jgi:hypothetical protein
MRARDVPVILGLMFRLIHASSTSSSDPSNSSGEAARLPDPGRWYLTA